MTHKTYESLLTRVLNKAIRLEMRVSINFFDQPIQLRIKIFGCFWRSEFSITSSKACYKDVRKKFAIFY